MPPLGSAALSRVLACLRDDGQARYAPPGADRRDLCHSQALPRPRSKGQPMEQAERGKSQQDPRCARVDRAFLRSGRTTHPSRPPQFSPQQWPVANSNHWPIENGVPPSTRAPLP